MRLSKQILFEILDPIVVDVRLMYLQLLRLRRFGPSVGCRQSPSDRAVQSGLRSQKQVFGQTSDAVHNSVSICGKGRAVCTSG